MTGARVVVTGAEGPIAMAVQQALRQEGYDVTGVVRGDDLDAALPGAKAVVVLDAARAIVRADYELALGAVAATVGSSSVERIVTLTRWPVADAGFDRLAQGIEDAERDLAGLGIDLVPIRFGLVVGTPKIDGPVDNLLFEDEGKLYYPGNGAQRLRPLLVDDLAKVAVAALKAPVAPVVAEGPKEMTLGELLVALNGVDVKPRPLWRRLVVHRAIPIFPRVEEAARQLPAKDWLIGDSLPTNGILGVAPQPIATAWTTAARSVRSRRRMRARQARGYRNPEWTAVVAALLMIIGGGAAVIGFHDLLSLPTLGARLVSVGLLLAGAFVAIGGLALLTAPKWRPRYAVGFMAAVVALLLLVGLTAASLINRDVAWWWLVWIYFGVFVLAACVALWRRGNLSVESFMRTSVKVVGSVVAAGFVVAFVQFLYSAVYVPTTVTPTLTADVELRPGQADRGMYAVDAIVTLKNASSHAINVVGGVYRVEGARVRPVRGRLAAAEIDADRWRRSMIAGEPIGSPVERVAREALARAALVPIVGVFLEPDEEIERRFVVHVPRRFDLASLDVQLVTARRRFRGIADMRTNLEQTPDGPVATTVAKIDDPSLLHKLIRTSRYIHVVEVPSGSVPSGCGGRLAVYVDDSSETNHGRAGCADFERRKAEHYGISSTSAFTEVQLASATGGEAGGRP